MARQPPDKPRDVPLSHLLPNLLTITAICAGLTAIRFGYQGDFETAVRLVLLACVLDGLDGRLARLMRCQSSVGAELDTLADFLNFGVAPALIVHAWTLQDFQRVGWITVLSYAICCVLRLARFNVSSKSETDVSDGTFFEGVPSPAGAILVMAPMYIAFLLPDLPATPPTVVAAYVFCIGLLMISRIKTYSFKNITVSRTNAKFAILGVALLLAAVLSFLWITLVFLTLTYVVGLIWTSWALRKSNI
ncbi:MAG: CDP-diacylglycerol--serine O-phosphatidyltransferase [Litoreibacter sp.]